MKNLEQMGISPLSEVAKEDRLDAISEMLEEGIKGILNSEDYKRFLETMAKFHNYSYRNTLLIMLQNPDATHVAGAYDWKNKFNRIINKGEKAMYIIRPETRKSQRDKVDKNGVPIVDENGEPVKETYTVFRPAPVFDIAQTNGDPLPEHPAHLLTGDAKNFKVYLDAIKSVSPVPIEFSKIEGGANGYFSRSEGKIVINEGLSQMQTLKTAVHELAHSILHDDENKAKDITRERKEVEAESVAFIVMKHFGMDTSNYSFGYVAGWGKANMEEFKAALTTIRKCSNDIITKMEEKLTLTMEKENKKTEQTETREIRDIPRSITNETIGEAFAENTPALNVTMSDLKVGDCIHTGSFYDGKNWRIDSIVENYGMVLKNMNLADIESEKGLFGNWRRHLTELNWFYLGNEKSLTGDALCYTMQDTFEFAGVDSCRHYSSVEDLMRAFENEGRSAEIGLSYYIYDGMSVDEKYLGTEGFMSFTGAETIDASLLKFFPAGDHGKEAVAMLREIAIAIPEYKVINYNIPEFDLGDTPTEGGQSETTEDVYEEPEESIKIAI